MDIYNTSFFNLGPDEISAYNNYIKFVIYVVDVEQYLLDALKPD